MFWCCVVVTIMGNNYIYVLVNVGCVTRHSGTCVCVCGSLSGVSECIAVGVTITISVTAITLPPAVAEFGFKDGKGFCIAIKPSTITVA